MTGRSIAAGRRKRTVRNVGSGPFSTGRPRTDDRDVKLALHARHSVPETWLIDVASRSLSVCRDPGPDGYRDVRTLDVPRVLEPQALPGVPMDLSNAF